MGNQANVLMYFMQAGLVVKTVMLLLAAASITSWTLIFQRAWFFNQKKQLTDAFNRRFWESGDLSRLYADVDSNSDERQGMAAIFHSGFKEFIRARKQGNVVIEPIQRVMQITHAKEAEKLEKHLPFLLQ